MGQKEDNYKRIIYKKIDIGNRRDVVVYLFTQTSLKVYLLYIKKKLTC